MYKDIVTSCEIDFNDFCIHNDIDYTIAYNELEYYPRGYVFKKDNGRYHVVLNGKHSIEQLKMSFIHDLNHILENHLDMHKSLREVCEEEANSIVGELNLALI